jgi:hypothetical protein
MSSWQVQDAKARFSEFLDATIKKGPQVGRGGGDRNDKYVDKVCVLNALQPTGTNGTTDWSIVVRGTHGIARTLSKPG